MEPPSFKSKSAKPARRVRKNSKPDSSDFFNANIENSNFNNGGVQLSAPSQNAHQADTNSASHQPGPNMMNPNTMPPQNNTNMAGANMAQNQASGGQFYQPQQGNFNNNINMNQSTSNQGNNFNPNNPAAFMTPGNGMASGLMANMAMNYGENLKSQGAEMMGKYLDSKGLKLYFQVDTQYVRSKLFLLFLPFLHKDWSQRNLGNNNAPLSPKDDVNVPDLYIPSMGLLTYVLLAGILVGRNGTFTPEALGASLSTGISWIVFEVVIVSLVMYLINLRTDMKTYDVTSYLGYKFVPVCGLMIAQLLTPGLYWLIFCALSASCAIFIYKTLTIKVNNTSVASNEFGSADRQMTSKNYISIAIAVVQPILMYVLTYSF